MLPEQCSQPEASINNVIEELIAFWTDGSYEEVSDKGRSRAFGDYARVHLRPLATGQLIATLMTLEQNLGDPTWSGIPLRFSREEAVHLLRSATAQEVVMRRDIGGIRRCLLLIPLSNWGGFEEYDLALSTEGLDYCAIDMIYGAMILSTDDRIVWDATAALSRAFQCDQELRTVRRKYAEWSSHRNNVTIRGKYRDELAAWKYGDGERKPGPLFEEKP